MHKYAYIFLLKIEGIIFHMLFCDFFFAYEYILKIFPIDDAYVFLTLLNSYSILRVEPYYSYWFFFDKHVYYFHFIPMTNILQWEHLHIWTSV